MRRPTRLLALMLTAAALVVPTGAADAACTSDLPVSDPRAGMYTCTGVTTGMRLLVPSQKWGPDYQCGAGWAFTDQFKQRYLSFPGDCFLDYDCLEDAVYEVLPPPLNELVPRAPVCLNPGDSELEPTYRRPGPVVEDENDKRIGTIVYAVNKNDINFALVRIDPNVKLDPAMPVYGGPRRIGAMSTSLEEAYVYTPMGIPTFNARSGFLRGTAAEAYWLGDSLTSISYGSPVMKPNGDAVGMLTGTTYFGSGAEIQELPAALARATSRTGLRLKLLTAPLATK